LNHTKKRENKQENRKKYNRIKEHQAIIDGFALAQPRAREVI